MSLGARNTAAQRRRSLRGGDNGGGWAISSGARRNESLDIEQTVQELERKGVEFVSQIEDEGWGRIAQFRVPGAGEIALYAPRHPSPLPEFAGSG